MLIEIRPGPLSNKGGELMLRAALGELAPPHTIAVEHWVADYGTRARLGLYQKVWIRRLGRLAGVPAKLLPRRVMQMYGLVAESDIEAVVDASGFAYSDQFGAERTQAMARLARMWKRRGKPLILLPQAFGPFSGARMRRAARQLIESADLVYARDRASLEHVRGLGVTGADVRMAPDFTMALPSKPEPAAGARTAYVVPNEKMVTHTPGRDHRSYVEFLADVIRHLQDRGVPTAMLLHEPAADRKLGAQVRDLVGHSVPLIVEEDAMALRTLIGTASFVVGSRYHALVSALAQGVPVLAAGWSHKYEELLRDFDCEDLLVAPTVDRATLGSLLDRLIHEAHQPDVRDALGRRGDALRDQIAAMWSEVHGHLRTSQASARR